LNHSYFSELPLENIDVRDEIYRPQ